MNIFKRTIKVEENQLFDSKGKFIITKENCYLMDAILTVFAAGIQINNLHVLHLEIFRCGIYISYPELKQSIQYLEKEGLLSIGGNLN